MSPQQSPPRSIKSRTCISPTFGQERLGHIVCPFEKVLTCLGNAITNLHADYASQTYRLIRISTEIVTPLSRSLAQACDLVKPSGVVRSRRPAHR